MAECVPNMIAARFHGDDMVFLRWGDPTLMQFEDEIREQIAKEILPEEAERGLAVYLHNELLKEKCIRFHRMLP